MPRQSYSANNYVGGASPGYLNANISSSSTSIVVNGTNSSWGTLGVSGGFFLSINYATAIEEKIWVPSGTYSWSSPPVTLNNVQRGADGTTALSQSINYSVVPILAATDLAEANALVSQTLGLVTTASGEALLSNGTGLVFGIVSTSGGGSAISSLSGPGLTANPGALVQSGGFTIWDATTSGINFTTSGVLTATTTSGITFSTHQKINFTSASGTNIISSGTILISGSNLAFYPPVLTSGITRITSASGSLVITSGYGPTTNIEIALGSGTVSSVFGRTGTVTANTGDYTVAQVTGAAPLASPALTGTPTAPTQTALSNNTDIATTAYADYAVSVASGYTATNLLAKAPIASPTFTGTITHSGTTIFSGGTNTLYGPTVLSGTVSISGTVTSSGMAVVSNGATLTFTNISTGSVLYLSANSATPAINTNTYNIVEITAQSTAITSMTTNLTGSPSAGNTLHISFVGTGTFAITWGSSFESSTVTLPTTTVGTARLDVGLMWNDTTSKWRCVAVA